MNKKGSHIGMMLSLAIFITFLVFLFSILQPMIKTEQDKKMVLDSLRTELVNVLGSDITSYSGGSIRTLNDNFTTSLNQLATKYNDNYKELKIDLKMPANSEFGFNFVNIDGITEIIAEKNIPQSTSIYVNEIPVYYVGGEADILLGFINLKIW